MFGAYAGVGVRVVRTDLDRLGPLAAVDERLQSYNVEMAEVIGASL
ncbi:MAG: hypothetical protein ACTHMY_25160 [Solirubrobacteraceae bacterium]